MLILFAAPASVQAQSCPVSFGGVTCEAGISQVCPTASPGPTCRAVEDIAAREAGCRADQELNCGSCTCVCSSGIDCDGVCQSSQQGDPCTTDDTGRPGTLNRCGTVCSESSRPSVILAPFEAQIYNEENPAIWINKTGAADDLLLIQQGTANRLRLEANGSLWIQGSAGAGDLYLNDGRTIRIDDVAQTSLGIGNYDSGAGAGHHFQLRIHAPGEARSELVFDQGGDRWALSTRDGSRNLEIWRNSGGWDDTPMLSVDYTSGNIEITNDLTVEGRIRVIGDAVISSISTNVTLGDAGDWIAVNGTLMHNGNHMYLPRSDGAPTRRSGDRVGALYYSTRGGDTGVRVFDGSDWVEIGGGGGDQNLLSVLTVGADGADASGFVGEVIIGDGAPSLSTGTTTGLRVGGDITASGCFGPTYKAGSAGDFDGDVDGDPNWGYDAANSKCGTGFHVCTTAEMLMSINCGVIASAVGLSDGDRMWISNGAPSLPTPTNDCDGWTSNIGEDEGIEWIYDANGGAFYARSCANSQRFACCR